MKAYYKEEVKLRASDFDYNDIIKPSSILSLFQDVASTHANMLNLGYKDILNIGGYFILLRTKFSVLQNPEFLSNVEVCTWPKKKNRLDFNREYEIYSNSSKIVTGISKWVIIDISTRKIMRNTLDVKHELYKEENYSDISKLRIDLDFDYLFEYRVMMSDIDHNKHLNNVKYLDLILENFKIDKPYTLQIDYIKEVKYNDLIRVYYKKVDNKYFYKGENINEELLFLVEINT